MRNGLSSLHLHFQFTLRRKIECSITHCSGFNMPNLRVYFCTAPYVRYHQEEGSKSCPVGPTLPTLLKKEAHWEVNSSEDWTNTACIWADLYAKKKWTPVYCISLKMFLLLENPIKETQLMPNWMPVPNLLKHAKRKLTAVLYSKQCKEDNYPKSNPLII